MEGAVKIRDGRMLLGTARPPNLNIDDLMKWNILIIDEAQKLRYWRWDKVHHLKRASEHT